MGSVWYKPACPLLPIRQSGAERPWKALAGYFLCSPMEQSGAVMVVMVAVCFFCLLFMSPRITSAQEGGSCPSSGLHKTSFFLAFWYFRQKMSSGVRMSLPTNCGHLLANVQINTSESGFMQICKDLVCLTSLFLVFVFK